MTAGELKRIWRASVRQYFAPVTWVVRRIGKWHNRPVNTRPRPTQKHHDEEGRT